MPTQTANKLPEPFPRRRSLKRALVAAAIICVLVAAAAWAFPHQLLCTDSGVTDADTMVILGGGWTERPARAIELFREHPVSHIIVTGAGDCELNRDMLREGGIPESLIVLECHSRSTKQNALFSRPLLQKNHARRVILVTSWFHSRRALSTFRHYAPGIEFYSRPSYDCYERRDWHRRHIGYYVIIEYVKTLGYWLCYGVPPLAS